MARLGAAAGRAARAGLPCLALHASRQSWRPRPAPAPAPLSAPCLLSALSHPAPRLCPPPPACHPCRLLDEAWAVYRWMLADGLRPDRPTYSRLISVCAYSEPLRGEAEGLWAALVEAGHEVDTFMYLHLATALGSGERVCGGWRGVCGRGGSGMVGQLGPVAASWLA